MYPVKKSGRPFHLVEKKTKKLLDLELTPGIMNRQNRAEKISLKGRGNI
jgi:hypothetical protein